MTPTNIVTYGLGGVAVFGILTMLLNKLATGSKVSDALKMFKKEEKQKELAEKVKTLAKEQEVVVKQLKAAELASEDSKNKVQQIIRKAAVEAQRVLKEDSLQEIDSQIDEDWNKL